MSQRADSQAANAIVAHVATPQRLSALLAEADVDFESVDRSFQYRVTAGAAASSRA